jgi:hypothetical protein
VFCLFLETLFTCDPFKRIFIFIFVLLGVRCELLFLFTAFVRWDVCRVSCWVVPASTSTCGEGCCCDRFTAAGRKFSSAQRTRFSFPCRVIASYMASAAPPACHASSSLPLPLPMATMFVFFAEHAYRLYSAYAMAATTAARPVNATTWTNVEHFLLGLTPLTPPCNGGNGCNGWGWETCVGDIGDIAFLNWFSSALLLLLILCFYKTNTPSLYVDGRGYVVVVSGLGLGLGLGLGSRQSCRHENTNGRGYRCCHDTCTNACTDRTSIHII